MQCGYQHDSVVINARAWLLHNSVVIDKKHGYSHFSMVINRKAWLLPNSMVISNTVFLS
jgi:hypothetical protein